MDGMENAASWTSAALKGEKQKKKSVLEKLLFTAYITEGGILF